MMSATLYNNNTDVYPETCDSEHIKLSICHYNNNICYYNICHYNIEGYYYISKYNIDSITNILTLFFVVSSSLLCSILFVSKYVYSSMVNQFIFYYNNNKERYDYDPYFFEYLDDLLQLESCELTDEF